jgi:hypothetical protein
MKPFVISLFLSRAARWLNISRTRGGLGFSNPEEERAQAELITAEHALAAGLAFSLVSSTCKATCGK